MLQDNMFGWQHGFDGVVEFVLVLRPRWWVLFGIIFIVKQQKQKKEDESGCDNKILTIETLRPLWRESIVTNICGFATLSNIFLGFVVSHCCSSSFVSASYVTLLCECFNYYHW